MHTPDLLRPARIPVVASLLLASLAQGSVVDDPERWTTNGRVQTIVRSGETIYIGGQFSYVGPRWTGGAVPVDLEQGEAVPGYPKVNGRVRAVIPDGAGGWFLGGRFTDVGGQARANVARVAADGSVTPWDPGVSGGGVTSVDELVLTGTTLWIGGVFTSVGGVAHQHLAAVDAATGVPRPWNVDASHAVHALAANDTAVFVGGAFTTLAAETRRGLGALDLSTGVPSTWNPRVKGSVLSLAASDTTLYVGGEFDTVGAMRRVNLAAVDLRTAAPLEGWRADANYGVMALAVSGSTVYAGGRFHDVAGHFRSRLVALDAITGAVGPWNPSSNDEVHAIVVDGATILVGGPFVYVGGAPRNHFAALDANTGAALAWQPVASSWVEALALNHGVLYVGGRFESFGGVTRNNVAAIDVATGRPTPSNVGTNGGVGAIVVTHGTVFIGGHFIDVNGEFHWSFAAVDSATGALRPWSLGCSFETNFPYPGYIKALALRGTTLYVSGIFDQIGGHRRPGIAAIDVTTGGVTGWNPGPSGTVESLVVRDSTVYLGGAFSSLGGQSRHNLGALHAVTAAPTPWNPMANGLVNALVVTDSLVYAGGQFTRVGGQDRHSLAAVSRTTGVVADWAPHSTNVGSAQVHDLVLHGGTLFAGGSFTNFGGQSRRNFAALDVETGLAEKTTADTDGMVHALLGHDGHLYLGGEFTMLGGAVRPYFTRLEVDDVTSTTLDLVSTQATPGLVELVWHSGAGAPATATVYRRTAREPWSAVGVIASDGRGRWSYEDPTVTPGGRYGYRLGFDDDGVARFAGEVWVDVPTGRGLALPGLRPHPASSRFQMAFALPDAAPARLELLDLAGRRVWSRDVGTLGAGAHVIEAGDARHFAPGVYHVRLTRNGRSLTTRAVLVR